MRKVTMVLGAGLVSVIALSPTAHAEQPGLPGDRPAGEVKLPADVRELIAALDDDRFAERQRATNQLRNAGVLGDEMLVSVLRSGELSLEQRVRLISLLRERFDKDDRAAIGLQFRPGVLQPCVGELFPKFPAAVEGVLRKGDVFLEVDGITIKPSEPNEFDQHAEIIGLISSFSPGDRVPMKIFRPKNPPAAPAANAVNGQGRLILRLEDLGEGDTLEVVVPMGRRSDLNRNADGRDVVDNREQRLSMAWKYKLARMGLQPVTGPTIEFASATSEGVRAGRQYNAPSVRMTPGPTQVGEHDGQRQFAMMDFDPMRRQQMRLMNNAQVLQRARVQIFASDGNQIRFPGEFPAPLVVPESAGTPNAGPPAVPDDVGLVVSRLERARVELDVAEESEREAETPADRAAHALTADRLRDEIGELEAQLEGLMGRSGGATRVR